MPVGVSFNLQKDRCFAIIQRLVKLHEIGEASFHLIGRNDFNVKAKNETIGNLIKDDGNGNDDARKL